MTEATDSCRQSVDREINLLHDAYDALSAMDRAGQHRALWWLKERLDQDELRSTQGKEVKP